MVSDGNGKSASENSLFQEVIQRKLQLFRHICRMSDSLKMKLLFLVICSEITRYRMVGRPHIEWIAFTIDWCRGSLQELSYMKQDNQSSI